MIERSVARGLTAMASVLTSYPRAATLCLAAITLGAILALPSFRIDSDIANLLPDNIATMAVRKAASTRSDSFSQNSLLIVLRTEDPAALEAAIPKLQRELLEVAGILEVQAAKSEFLGTQLQTRKAAPLWFVDDATRERLRDALQGEARDQAIAKLQSTIATDPLLGVQLARRDPLGLRFVFEDAQRSAFPALDPASPYLLLTGGRTAFLRMRAERPPQEIEFTNQLLGDLDAAFAKFEAIDATVISGYVWARDDAARIRGDMVSSTVMSAALVTAFLAFSMRSLFAPLAMMLPLALGIFWGLTYGGFALGPLSPIAAGSAAVLAGLGIDFGIHWYSGYRDSHADPNIDSDGETASTWPGRVAATHQRLGPPILLGAATTITAFLTFLASDFRGLWGFGVLLALGLAAILLATFTVLPLLVRFRIFVTAPQASGSCTTARALQRLTTMPATKTLGIGMLGVAALGWVATGLLGVTFDADARRLRPTGDPMIEAASALEDELGLSVFPLSVLWPTSTPADTARAGLERLGQAPGIALLQSAHLEVPNPERRARVAEFTASTEGWVDDAVAALDAQGFNGAAMRGTLDESQALFTAPAPTPDLAARALEFAGERYAMAQLYPKATPWNAEDRAALRSAIDGSMTDVPGVRVASPLGLADELSPVLARDLVRCGLLAAALISVLVVILLGSLTAGVLALLPTLCALGLMLGGLAVFGWPLHLGNFVAVPLILGIGIDDGIHMVTALRAGRPLREVLGTTGVAVWRTSATTVLAFGTLAFATSPGLASLGVLLTVGVAICFVCSVLVLPWLVPERMRAPMLNDAPPVQPPH